MNKDQLKQQAAQAAITFIEMDTVVGVGTGSTTHFFIEELAKIKGRIEGAVASSVDTEQRLKAAGIPALELNSVNRVPVYVDGADEFNPYLCLIKGGGGALTREKIIAASAEKFVCIVDSSKQVDVLGQFPLPIEVIPMARSFVAREMVKLGGTPNYREGFVTDNGNHIIDVYNLDLSAPLTVEERINNIAGVVTNGIFSHRPADVVLMAAQDGVKEIHAK